MGRFKIEVKRNVYLNRVVCLACEICAPGQVYVALAAWWMSMLRHD